MDSASMEDRMDRRTFNRTTMAAAVAAVMAGRRATAQTYPPGFPYNDRFDVVRCARAANVVGELTVYDAYYDSIQTTLDRMYDRCSYLQRKYYNDYRDESDKYGALRPLIQDLSDEIGQDDWRMIDFAVRPIGEWPYKSGSGTSCLEISQNMHTIMTMPYLSIHEREDSKQVPDQTRVDANITTAKQIGVGVNNDLGCNFFSYCSQYLIHELFHRRRSDYTELELLAIRDARHNGILYPKPIPNEKHWAKAIKDECWDPLANPPACRTNEENLVCDVSNGEPTAMSDICD